MMTVHSSLTLVGLLATLAAPINAREREARRWTPSAIASDQYEATPTFTPDGREMYFMRSDPRFERHRLLWSRCENGAWTQPETAPFAIAGVQEGDPGVTPDGKRLYFISMRHNPAREDFDIWYVERTSAGAWGEPQRMPEPVNSPGAELLPRADASGRLYFGSDRAGGFGGGDIYVATQGENGDWTVNNAGPPISSAAYEYEAEVSQDGRSLVAVVNRGERSHLYAFERVEHRWIERGRIAAFGNVFQVGPLLSPGGDRLLFAQSDGARSGELFLLDLTDTPDARWPPCERR